MIFFGKSILSAACTNEQWIPNYLYGQKEVGLGFTLIIYRHDSVLMQQVRMPFDILICSSSVSISLLCNQNSEYNK